MAASQDEIISGLAEIIEEVFCRWIYAFWSAESYGYSASRSLWLIRTAIEMPSVTWEDIGGLEEVASGGFGTCNGRSRLYEYYNNKFNLHRSSL